MIRDDMRKKYDWCEPAIVQNMLSRRQSLVARVIYGKCEVSSGRRDLEAIEVYVTWEEIQDGKKKNKDIVPILSAKCQPYNLSISL
jgi:hypothetical protein